MTSLKFRVSAMRMLFVVAAVVAATAARTTTYSITTIATRPGVTVPLMITDKTADTPARVGTLILFTGGNGQLNLLTNWPANSDQSGLMTHDTDSSSNFYSCSITPPIGVNKIARNLLSSPDFRGKFVTNDIDPVDPTDTCDATGYHGFSNVEGKVVSPVTAWIIGHLPTP